VGKSFVIGRRPVGTAGRRLLLVAIVAACAGVVIATGEARSPVRGGVNSSVGRVSHRLLRFLNSNGPAAFRLAGSGAEPKITRRAAIRDALRDARWRPAAAKGISLVRFAHRAGSIPARTLAWLVRLKPRKPVYDGTKAALGPAANYFVVIIRTRDGRFLGSEDGYANRSGGAGWSTAELA